MADINSLNLKILLDSNYFLYIFIFLIVLVLFLGVVFFLQLRKTRDLTEKLEVTKRLYGPINSQMGLDRHINAILDVLISVFEAEGYHFYVYDEKAQRYVLKVSRHRSDSKNIDVKYNGLVQYKKGQYNPPLGIPGTKNTGGVEIVRDGEVPLLEIRFKEGKGLIRIGPVSSVPSKTKKLFEYISIRLEPLLHLLLELDNYKNYVETINSTNKAINQLSKSAFSTDKMINQIMAIASQLLEAGGCCLAIRNGSWEIPLITTMSAETDSQFRRDKETLDRLYSLLKNKEYHVIQPESKEYYVIPYYFLASGVHSMIVIKLDSKNLKGMAVFWHNRAVRIEKRKLSLVEMIVQKLGEIWEQQTKFKELSASYQNLLKVLVDTTDNFSNHSVGHAELVARYSSVIAVEMGLSSSEVANIKLAAYFHDVGMIGLSGDILFKPGRYTALEYETMKLHAEVGASIIDFMLSNSVVGNYVRHHHERWDGYGYPAGLKGEQIPIGSRIIAVAEFFVAKLQGRKYREPVSFEEAISSIMAASGTQLAPEPVEALLSWFDRKQSQAARGRALGPCWQMRCSPSHICQKCPAYGKTDMNCWEIDGVNCEEHGNECQTCFIRTEVLYREKRKTVLQERRAPAAATATSPEQLG